MLLKVTLVVMVIIMTKADAARKRSKSSQVYSVLPVGRWNKNSQLFLSTYTIARGDFFNFFAQHENLDFFLRINKVRLIYLCHEVLEN